MGVRVTSMFGIREYSREPENTLPDPLAKVGIEVEVENCPRRMLEGEGIPDSWECKVDHSLRNDGAEFVTDGGMVGAQIFSALERLVYTLVCEDANDGDPRAAIHVHVDISGHTSEDLQRLVSTYLLLENGIFSYCGEWRRACGFCNPLSNCVRLLDMFGSALASGDINRVAQVLSNHEERYSGINLSSISNFGTVEFRHLPTTFRLTTIKNYIRLAVGICAFSKSEDNDPVRTFNSGGVGALLNAVLTTACIPAQRVWSNHVTADNAASALKSIQYFMEACSVKDAVPPKLLSWDDELYLHNPILSKRSGLLKEAS